MSFVSHLQIPQTAAVWLLTFESKHFSSQYSTKFSELLSQMKLTVSISQFISSQISFTDPLLVVLLVVSVVTVGSLRRGWCWISTFQWTESDISTEPQHKLALHFSWLHLGPETGNQPLHRWSNIFHRLWLLSDSCGANTAQRWGTIFHKFLWHGSTNRLKKSNEAPQTWDSIFGDSPFWSRRIHYVMLCTAV